MKILILLSLMAFASAQPSYIFPKDRIAIVDLSRLHLRVPRQAELHPRVPRQAELDPRVPRQALTPPPYNEQYLPIPIQGLQPYQPIPVQQYQQIQQAQNLIPIVPNQALPQQHQPQEPQDISGAPAFGDPSSSADRPPDFGEYVDFGAHTGDNGAFGWYADYPVNGHQDSIGFR